MYLQIGQSDSSNYNICTDGFIFRNVYVVDFKDKYPIDFQTCLFLVLPPSYYEVQKNLQKKIRTLQTGLIDEDKPQDDVNSIIRELQYEINEGVNNLSKTQGLPITYGQPF